MSHHLRAADATEPPVCPACGLEPPDPDGHAQRHGFDTLEALEASLTPEEATEKLARTLEGDLRARGYGVTTTRGLKIAKAGQERRPGGAGPYL